MLMPRVVYEPYVEIIVDGDIKFETKFINSLYVYRMPIIKSASFALLTLPLPVGSFNDFEDVLLSGGFPEIKLKFNLADMDVKDPPHSFKKLEAGVEFYYSVMHMTTRSNFSTTSEIAPVSFYLVQTFIHDLFLGNSFNRIFYDLSAYEALLEYEDFISDRFEGKIEFKKILDTTAINEYKYKNILIKSANDLMIPHYLMSTYKISNSLNFYFFDDFDLVSTEPVVGFFVDFTKPTGEPWRIFEDDDKFDISRTLRSKGKIPLGDKIEMLRRSFDAASIHIKHPSGSTYHRKIKKEVLAPQLLVSNIIGNIHGRRNVVTNVSKKDFKEKDTNQHITLYTPDNFENAINRYDRLKGFLREETEAIFKFEVYECHIDAIQFYRTYTLDQTNTKMFYNPISIVNIFSRINPHETIVNHTAQFQCISFPEGS